MLRHGAQSAWSMTEEERRTTAYHESRFTALVGMA